MDIGMSVSNVDHLGDESKCLKLLKRVENYIELTNLKTLTGGPGKSNLKGAMSIYSLYALYQQGSDPFFKKLETILETDLENKNYKLELDEICPMLNAMALKKCMNE